MKFLLLLFALSTGTIIRYPTFPQGAEYFWGGHTQFELTKSLFTADCQIKAQQNQFIKVYVNDSQLKTMNQTVWIDPNNGFNLTTINSACQTNESMPSKFGMIAGLVNEYYDYQQIIYSHDKNNPMLSFWSSTNTKLSPMNRGYAQFIIDFFGEENTGYYLLLDEIILTPIH